MFNIVQWIHHHRLHLRAVRPNSPQRDTDQLRLGWAQSIGRVGHHLRDVQWFFRGLQRSLLWFTENYYNKKNDKIQIKHAYEKVGEATETALVVLVEKMYV